MSKSTLIIDTPETCGDCPFCVFTAEEKNYIGYCNTSDDDFYCKVLQRFMEYDEVDGGVDILGKPTDCPLQEESEDAGMKEIDFIQPKKTVGKLISVDVLDKIRAEIVDCLKALDDIEKSGYNIYLPNEISGRRLTYQQCLEIIDKYKGEIEQVGNPDMIERSEK